MIHDEAQAFLAGVEAGKASAPGLDGLGAALERASQLISPSLRVSRWVLGQARFMELFGMGLHFAQEVAE